MTDTNTTFDPPTPPAGGYSAPPPPPRTGRAGVGSIVIGAVLVGLGFLTAASGTALLFLFGAGQVIGSGQHPISTGTSAVVADLGQIHGIDDFRAITGSPTLSFSAQNVGQDGVFVGVGRTEDVERYLAGVPIERVNDLELMPYHLSTKAVQGTGTATAPGRQGFWVASSESTNQAEFTWLMSDGSYELVVMNADGSAGFVTSAEIGVALPDSTGVWITVIAIGGGVMIIGGALLVVGISSNKGRR